MNMSSLPTEEPSGFAVRSAKSLGEVLELWWPLMKELEWNRDHDDAITHYHVARKGSNWLLVVSNESNKPEGCVVAFTYPNSTGWVGFFCVNAPYRGKGLGRALWNGLEASFRTSNTTFIGLDGVEQQVNTYRRRGFVDLALINLMTRPSLEEKPIFGEIQTLGDMKVVVDIRNVDVKALAEMDKAHTGFDRSALWTEEALFSRKDAYGLAIVSSADKTALSGYVLVRRSQHGHRVGPLYAETYVEALNLLRAATEAAMDRVGSFIAEIFGTNPNGKRLFEELGWNWAGIDYHRMWFEGRVPKEQQEGGRGAVGMFATFDAAEG
ncbi:hypothetical protein CC78DRAFT_616594 [Lojkania enalia]|uniref:N-acetyltransferase domain-containing protein n=1 Tax=Lojkania enalia TaxID=147567 RepID=A0A9P4K9R6_9PLEO|nr:hypothetical protein CC78DRAFT_616594 [Didymosphaeria enalia]